MSVEINSIVDGEVVRIKAFGAIVELPDKKQGLVHISHISNRFIQDINEFLSVGDIVKVKVLSVDEATGKIALSMKEAAPPEPVQAPPPRSSFGGKQQNVITEASPFEDKLKDWIKNSNERQAGINKRNKRR